MCSKGPEKRGGARQSSLMKVIEIPTDLQMVGNFERPKYFFLRHHLVNSKLEGLDV